MIGYDRPEKTAEVLFEVLDNLDEYKAKTRKYALSIWGNFSAAELISSELIEFLIY